MFFTPTSGSARSGQKTITQTKKHLLLLCSDAVAAADTDTVPSPVSPPRLLLFLTQTLTITHT